MGNITDLYVAGKIGYAAGEHFAGRVQRSAQNAQALYYNAAAVNDIRSAVYQKKKEIVTSSVTQDILNAIFTDPGHPPKEILFCASGVIVSSIEANMRSYHPTGVMVYASEVPMSYEMGAALCLIIQDMYPQTYDFPNIGVDELTTRLNDGTWYTVLNLKQPLLFKTLCPQFTPKELYENLNNQSKISYTDPLKKNRWIYVLSGLVCVILSFVFSWVAEQWLFGLIFSVASLVFAFISQRKASKVAALISVFGALALGASFVSLLINEVFH